MYINNILFLFLMLYGNFRSLFRAWDLWRDSSSSRENTVSSGYFFYSPGHNLQSPWPFCFMLYWFNWFNCYCHFHLWYLLFYSFLSYSMTFTTLPIWKHILIWKPCDVEKNSIALQVCDRGIILCSKTGLATSLEHY